MCKDNTIKNKENPKITPTGIYAQASPYAIIIENVISK